MPDRVPPSSMSLASRAAFAEPEARAGWGFILLYALAYAGTLLALLTPIYITLAMRVREVAPASIENTLSLVLGAGALFALIGNPLFGRLSDRTTTRFGMRRPWMLGGALAGTLSLWLIAKAPAPEWVLIGWCLAQLSFNAVLAALTALLSDQISTERRGTVAGILGICTPLGTVVGTFLVQWVSGSMLLMFLLPATIGLVSVILLALVLPDRRLDPRTATGGSLAGFVSSFWVSPRRHADFAWMWLGRFMMMMGMAFLITYQPLYLGSRLGYAAADVPDLVFRSTLIQSIVFVVASLICGRLSDRLGRRKPFVIASAAAYALGAVIIAMAESYGVFLIAMAITGAGLGGFLAVDLALVTDVLPDRKAAAAKDLGIFNVASTLPQALAPAIGAAILAISANSYTALFIAAALAAGCASLAVVPVRGAR